MANPLLNNNTTITFDNIPTPSGKINIELVIHCGVASYDKKTADELGLIMLDVPSKKYDWDDREFWFGIGNCTLEVYDPTEILEEAIRDINFDYEKSSITITYKSDNSIYYKGYFDSDKYSKDYKNVLKLEFNPLTEKLARTPVQINGVWNNVVSSLGYAKDSSANLTEYITDVLKTILEPSLTVNFYCDWEFYHAGFEEWLSFEELTINRLRWLFQNASTDERYYYTNSYKDVINNFCRTFGFVVFFESFNKISFVQYLNYNINDVISPDERINVIDFKRSKNNSQIKLLKINSHSLVLYPSGAPPFIVPAFTLTYGEITGLDNDILEINYILNWASFRGFSMGKIRNKITLEEYNYDEFILQYYSRYYLSHYIQIEDDLTVSGLFPQPNQKLEFRNFLYFPLSIEYNLTENTTKIKGRPFAVRTDDDEIEQPVYNPNLATIPDTGVYNTPGYDNGTKVINELLYLVDGIKEYSLLNDYKPLSVEIFRNGQKLVLNVDYEETTSSKITFIIDIEVSDYIQVNYEKLL